MITNNEKYKLINIVSIESDRINEYGFYCQDNKWFDKDWSGTHNELKPATPQEVEAALVKEAVNRGFKEGVRFISVLSGEEVVCNGTFEYYKDTLYSKGMSVFSKGQWATILPKKQLTMSELEKLVGEPFEIKAD